jgi:hypothetical protein
MRVKLKTYEGHEKDTSDIRNKIRECADGIIDYISSEMIMDRIYDDFGHDLDCDCSERISNIVYNQIKSRM